VTSATLRVLLVDDEPAARDRLRQLLAAFEDVAIAGEAGDGEEAIERITSLKPDVVFLDIQMPGCNGMEVAASLPGPRPRIVFCTAYEQYAVDAFELHAVDYLLKPVTRARLKEAIERLRALPGTATRTAIDSATKSAGAWPARFLARTGSRYTVVPAAEVVCFLSEDGLTRLRTAGARYWMQPSLNELESRLDPGGFFRISRSAIVSLDAVREVHPLPGGGATVALSNGDKLEASRRRLASLMQKLGSG